MYYNFKEVDRISQRKWEIKELCKGIAASAVVLTVMYLVTVQMFCI